VTGQTRYYPFGETRVSTGSMPTDRLFTGQRAMVDLGIYFYNARFYSAALGRFLSADTILPDAGNSQSYSRYSYVGNNPLGFTDPAGHRGISIGGTGGKVTDKQIADSIYNYSCASDADFLVQLYRTNLLSGDTPRERTNTILNFTSDGTGYTNFNGGYGQTGFKSEFQDKSGTTGDQVEHFMTAVNWGVRANLPGESWLYQSAIIGHEMIGNVDDNNPALNRIVQGIYGSNPIFHSYFNSGNNYGAILNYADTVFEGSHPNSNLGLPHAGNSMADLRLSKVGWDFGQNVLNGSFATNGDAANWLKDKLIPTLHSSGR
jgi:RHS repeat-associated protein